MSLNIRDFQTNDRTTLDAQYFQRRWRILIEAVNALDEKLLALEGSDEALVALGIARINEAIGPAVERLTAAAEGGILTASSDTPATLVADEALVLVLNDNGALDVFAPTPFVTLTRRAEGSLGQFASCRVSGYDPATGALSLVAVTVSTDLTAAGEVSDWFISASGGLAADVLQAAIDVQETLTLAQAAAATAEQAATDAAAILASGPVSSVNGQTGAVVIDMNAISGLVSALAGKAASSHGHSASDVLDGGTY